jgi:serine/threonine-protein kinase RsbW
MQAVEPHVVKITIPCSAEFAATVRLVTTSVSTGMGFSSEEIDDLKTAVGEAVNNALQHAYPESEEESNLYRKKINVDFNIYEDKLAVVVRDFGRGFDYRLAERYMERADIEKPERIGRGMMMIKQLIDEVEFDSVAFEGTVVRMTKYRGAAGNT